MPTAPMSTMETVTVVRPLKVIALLCLCFAVVLQGVSLLTTFWLKSGASRFGLFEECTSPDPDLLDLGVVMGAPAPGECQGTSMDRGYIKAVAALLIIGLVLLVASSTLTVFGLLSKDFSRKYLFYRIAMYFGLFVVLLNLVSLLTFPISFYNEMSNLGRPSWEFDWSYGMAWGSTLFVFGASLLLICDKEHEELYLKEKVIYNAPADL